MWARKAEYGVYVTGLPGLNDTKLVNSSRHMYDDLNGGETFDRNGAPSHRAGDRIPCVGSFTIPKDAAPGRYQFVWA